MGNGNYHGGSTIWRGSPLTGSISGNPRGKIPTQNLNKDQFLLFQKFILEVELAVSNNKRMPKFPKSLRRKFGTDFLKETVSKITDKLRKSV